MKLAQGGLLVSVGPSVRQGAGEGEQLAQQVKAKALCGAVFILAGRWLGRGTAGWCGTTWSAHSSAVVWRRPWQRSR